MKYIFLTFTFYLIIGCFDNSKPNVSSTLSFNKSNSIVNKNDTIIKYKFICHPSFEKGFEVEYNPNENFISFNVNEMIYVADSMNKSYFQLLDRKKLDEIKDYLPNKSTFQFELNNSQKKQIEENFNRLSNLKFKGEIGMYDGTTFRFLKTKGDSILIQNDLFPDFDKSIDENLISFFDFLNSVITDNQIAIELLENSAIDRNQKWKIISKKPLFIRISNFSNRDCDELANFINELPSSKEIYIDITNSRYIKQGKSCFTDNFYKKYKNINWITKNAINEDLIQDSY